MIRFECDYAEGAHPRILQKLSETNLEQTPGYGLDAHCEHARALLRAACGAPDAEVHFLVGGTQANFTVIACALRSYQGVLCADTGHINGHETGAVEATGHKVLSLPNRDGKISAEQVQAAWDAHRQDSNREHTVQPGMVYISHPTELGTLYTKKELQALHETCAACGIPLFLDGARLGYGLVSPVTDVTLADIAQLCDVFYIGGTKVGALFGEAVVITNPALKRDFRYSIKQHGGMLAKGRLLGIQFETLFEDGLYTSLAQSAVDGALRIREALAAKGFAFLYPSFTNQQFPILPSAARAALEQKYVFGFWERVDEGHTAVRICTSWATQKSQIDALVEDICALP